MPWPRYLFPPSTTLVASLSTSRSLQPSHTEQKREQIDLELMGGVPRLSGIIIGVSLVRAGPCRLGRALGVGGHVFFFFFFQRPSLACFGRSSHSLASSSFSSALPSPCHHHRHRHRHHSSEGDSSLTFISISFPSTVFLSIDALYLLALPQQC